MLKRKDKIRVAVLFGGKSVEHEISIQSAKSIADAIDKKKYEIVLIYIDKKGKWHFCSEFRIQNLESGIGNNLALIPGGGEESLVVIANCAILKAIDIVFPVLHGPFGEDGTVQGLLKLANIPFVGASVLGSALSMDKNVAKRLMRDAGIPTPRFLVLRRAEIGPLTRDSIFATFSRVKKYLGLPFFVKPANLGSSVGINKVKNKQQFRYSIEKAFKYDNKILAEEYVKGREIECSVLGNDKPIASIPGEIILRHEFYSYKAKYIDKNGAILKVPANLSNKIVKKIQNLAIKTFKALECEGMARVDFFLRDNKQIFVNEINTIPGFTAISMYPKLWETSGISYTKLIDKLIKLAIERFQKEQKLKTFYDG